MTEDTRFAETIELLSQLMNSLIHTATIDSKYIIDSDDEDEANYMADGEFPVIIWKDKSRTLREICEICYVEDSIGKDRTAGKFVQDYLDKTMNDLCFDKKFTSLKMLSFCGENEDRRSKSGNHGFKKLPWVWNKTRETGLTIRDITEACYMLKGSKFDFWYELYQSIQLLEFTGEHAAIEIHFDHGS